MVPTGRRRSAIASGVIASEPAPPTFCPVTNVASRMITITGTTNASMTTVINCLGVLIGEMCGSLDIGLLAAWATALLGAERSAKVRALKLRGTIASRSTQV